METTYLCQTELRNFQLKQTNEAFIPKTSQQKKTVTAAAQTVLFQSQCRKLLYGIFIFLLLADSVNGCYKYPPGKKNPCEGHPCNFGAKCVPSLDGTAHRCMCEERCDSFGDNIGSTAVCGNDGVDYPNMCELKRAACHSITSIRVKYYGKCGMYHFGLFFCLISVCIQLFLFGFNSLLTPLHIVLGVRCNSMVRAFDHGVMGRRIDPSRSYFSFQPVLHD